MQVCEAQCQTRVPWFQGMPDNHSALNPATGAKHDVTAVNLNFTAAPSTLQPLKFTALCDKDVTHARVHQGYKRFYPPAT